MFAKYGIKLTALSTLQDQSCYFEDILLHNPSRPARFGEAIHKIASPIHEGSPQPSVYWYSIDSAALSFRLGSPWPLLIKVNRLRLI